MGIGGGNSPTSPYGPAFGGGAPRGQQKMQPQTSAQPGQIQGGTGSVPAGAVPTGAAPGVQQPNSAPTMPPTSSLNDLVAQFQSGGGGRMAPQFYGELARTLGIGPGGAAAPAPGAAPPAGTPQVTGVGGTPLPVDYQTPIGPVEQFLQQQLRAPTSNPFVDSLASGQVPTATMQQFQNEQARQAAMLAEQMQGARFGSDYAGAFGRQQGQALTNLMAQSEQQALAARGMQLQGLQTQYGLGGGLMGSETGRADAALQRLLSEYGGSTGLPPQITGLLGLLGIGGGTTTGRGTAGKFL